MNSTYKCFLFFLLLKSKSHLDKKTSGLCKYWELKTVIDALIKMVRSIWTSRKSFLQQISCVVNLGSFININF